MPSVVTSTRAARKSARLHVEREPKGALPQFAFPDAESSDADADKTLKRRAVQPRAGSSDEIGAEDILEEIDRPDANAAGATQEVTVGDILEVVDKLGDLDALDAQIPAAKKREPHEALARPRAHAPLHEKNHEKSAGRAWDRPGLSSFAPVALDVALPVCRVEPAIEIEWDLPAPPRRSMTPFIAGALVVACGIIAATIVRSGVRSDATPPPIALLASSAKVPAAPPKPVFVEAPMARVVPIAVSPVAGDTGVPVVDVTALPRPPVGTINGLSGHRLFIDGHVARGASAEVKCGLHVVKVGSAGAAKMIDVPCGGEITVR